MTTDFSKPVATDAYATLLTGVNQAIQDLARGLDPVLTGTSTNIPTGAKRYNEATYLWERYNGTAWVAMATTYAINISGNAATATSALTAGSATTAGNVTGTVAVANGGTGAVSFTAGSILAGNGTSAIAPATAAQIVAAISTTAVANATSATNLAAGSGGTIPYQTAPATTAMLAAGTSGYVLKSGGTGAPSWADPNALVTAPSAVASVNGGQLSGLRNRAINGDMRVDQRNSGAAQSIVAAAAAAYTVDRFYATCTGANVSGQRVAGSAPDQYLYQFTGAASVTGITFGQRIEATNVYDMTSQTATFSVKLANSFLTTVNWAAYYPTAVDNWTARTLIASGSFTVNSTLTKYSTQIALGANITAGLAIELSVGAQISGTLQIGEFQLELGSVATSFERRPIGMELALCQRYYQTVQWMNSVVASAGSQDTYSVVNFSTMRAAPTIVKTAGSFTNCSNPNAASSGINFIQDFARSTAAGPTFATYSVQLSAEL